MRVENAVVAFSTCYVTLVVFLSARKHLFACQALGSSRKIVTVFGTGVGASFKYNKNRPSAHTSTNGTINLLSLVIFPLKNCSYPISISLLHNYALEKTTSFNVSANLLQRTAIKTSRQENLLLFREIISGDKLRRRMSETNEICFTALIAERERERFITGSF